VRNTRGVTGFVGTPTEPVPLSDKEVEALGVETTSAALEVDFKVGDNVQVTTGSFEGFSGRVESIDLEAQTVEVVVTMFGRETPVSLPVTQVVAED
jgi:transcriptional antiterminator NusG